MLAGEHSVVGREHDHRVIELAAAREGIDDRADRVVDREQRGEPAAIVARDPRDVVGGKTRMAANELRLVGDVALVERRRLRGRRVREAVRVARRRDRRLLAGALVGRAERAAAARTVVTADSKCGGWYANQRKNGAGSVASASMIGTA